MESKLLEVAITGTPAHITFKSSRPTLHFVSKATFISPKSNFVANGHRPIQASFSSATSSSSSFPIRCDKNCVFVLRPCADSININNKVWNMYFRDLLPRLVKAGDDGNCGSAAVCDTICLQVLSKRIHYGKFVAEAKFRESPTAYEDAIRAQDRAQLMELLTYETVEAAIKKRVEMKAKTFGQDVTVNQGEDVADPVYKIKPSLVANLYGEWIMPLTKQVQVEYLLRRLD
ncbi:chorismate mutase 3, chloroplastic [Quercus suber]|uniref:chorismate mutase 3, chloroplastic n=1 Tax=Quercus suber TaxID=58331 RepID=UPI0032DF22B9